MEVANNLPEDEDFGDSVSILNSSSIVPRSYDQYDETIEKDENWSEDDETNNESESGYEALKDDEFGNFVGFEGDVNECSTDFVERGNLKPSETVVNKATAAGRVENVEDTGVPKVESRASIPPLTTGNFLMPVFCFYAKRELSILRKDQFHQAVNVQVCSETTINFVRFAFSIFP
jgi:hypothetical protein